MPTALKRAASLAVTGSDRADMAESQADISRKIQVFMILRAGVMDEHHHLHAPKGRFGGRFISKALQSVLGRESKKVSGHSHSEPHVRGEPHHHEAHLGTPRTRGKARGTDVRGALASATTTREVSAAATAEARRITGRDIPFDFGGSDPQLAREHAEGVLRGLEQFPHARLHAVGVADLSTATRTDGGHGGGWARTRQLDDGSARIDFDAATSSPAGAAAYRAELEQSAKRRRMGRGHTTGDPMGNALHEMGHVAAGQGPAMNSKAHNLAKRFLAHAGHYEASGDQYLDQARRRLALGQELSTYATSGFSELTAEAVADVLAHGDDASPLSRLIMDLIEAETGHTHG